MIKVDISKCTGCRRCETACAFFHTGKINNRQARIKVTNLYETGIDGPIVCQQCRERYCLDCPVEALTLGPEGQVIVSPTVCQLCSACEKACPIGAIELFDGFVYVCDLCGGNPKCVSACTEGAITYEPRSSEKVSLENIKKQTAEMNPSEKRRFHIDQLGTVLRKKWSKQNA